MLLGEFRHSLDAKGRVFLPSRWREELATGVVVTKGLEGCLLVMTKQRFSEVAERLHELPLNRKTNRDYSRLFFSGASEERVDSQGRMSIPPALREFGGLGKEVVLVGVSDRAEIWDRATWSEYQSGVEEQYEQIAEQIEL
ncbi:MAG TPA: division/cell wall cluster transcriptional repressor MraZ [Actinomycetota bacterium]|nr:division/cell wall cluster transcriptional repressor MraZ [Actinomycetota bacterium]